ncbi:MAG: GntR family transcriptional regulator [Gaiellaceae bacterium]
MTRRLDKIPQRSLRSQIVVAIRDAIIQGKFRPGEKVPEEELADQLGVSRTPIREAIRILEQQGLVETRPKNGTFIARVDWGEARDGLLVRATLEELAVRQAIERMERREWEAFCARLGQLLDGMNEAIANSDPIRPTELDTEWHTLLIDAARNSYLSRAWRLVGLPFLIWSPERELYPLPPEKWSVFTGRHRKLLAALRRRDADLAAEAIRSHIFEKLLDLEEKASPAGGDGGASGEAGDRQPGDREARSGVGKGQRAERTARR